MTTPKIIIRRTYPVKCLACGFTGDANLGKASIQTVENGGEDWCPICGTLALVSKDYVSLEAKK